MFGVGMKADLLVRAALITPMVAAGGLLCARLGAAYVQRIAGGAEPDGATLRAALRSAISLRGGCSAPAPYRAWCVALLALACLPWVHQPSASSAARLLACAILLILALIDARCRLLPDALTLPLLWAGLLLSWAGVGVRLEDAVAAAAAGYLLLRGLDVGFEVWRGQAGLGGGDMKLTAALGAWLGWAPLPGVLLAACLAGIVFAVAGRGRQAWRAPLAFGPFLAMAGGFGLAGDPVVQFVFHLGSLLCTRSA